MKSALCFALLLACIPWKSSGAEQAPFSGPQPGERATHFKVIDITPGKESKERDPLADLGAKPGAIIFLHAVERSLVPLLRAIDRYGKERAELIQTEVVFLMADKVAGEQRAKAVVNSLKLNGRPGVSVDGAEGPGNYGLNKECMMTVLAVKDQKVQTNFALVQPSIADFPKILEALAKTCGDTNPPPAATLTAVPARPEMRAPTGAKKEPFPGAVPSDVKLNALLRQMIRPTNDNATVDRLRKEMEDLVLKQPELRKEAVDGWVRVLHFGDHYGTEYARKTGRELLEKWKPAK